MESVSKLQVQQSAVSRCARAQVELVQCSAVQSAATRLCWRHLTLPGVTAGQGSATANRQTGTIFTATI